MNSKSHESNGSSLIMRNPYESLSASKESSKFYDPSDHHIEVRQFESINDHQHSSVKNHYDIAHNQIEDKKNLQGFQEFSQKRQNINTDLPKTNQNIKQSHPSFNYPQRLTFENQSVSPFIRLQNPIKNSHDQNNEFRQSFNPLQNKVNQLEKMCKKLYELSLQQNQKYETQRASIVRIEHKIDYLLEFFQNMPESRVLAPLMTRPSNDNKKRSSIAQNTNASKKTKQIDFMNSSDKLSRYLEPPSSQEPNLRKMDQRSLYNNSKALESHRNKKVKPFIVNSDLQNESSIPQLYHNHTMEFIEEDKENVNSSNFVVYEHSKQYKPMMKKENQFHNQNYHTYQRVKNSSQKGQKLKKSSQKVQQRDTKLNKNKTQELRKLQSMSNQVNFSKNQDENKVMIRQRARSQNTTNRKRQKQENGKKKTYYEVSVTAPNADYQERQRNKSINNQSRIYEGRALQASSVFEAVEFPASYYPSKSIEMKQSLSSELPRHKRKEIIQNHNKTLLESIQEKKLMIDRELSKRLMKNAALLHGGSTNMLISKENY